MATTAMPGATVGADPIPKGGTRADAHSMRAYSCNHSSTTWADILGDEIETAFRPRLATVTVGNPPSTVLSAAQLAYQAVKAR
jgi:hypothetical protein